MKRLIQASDIQKQYDTMCKAIMYDVYGDNHNMDSDMGEVVDEIAKETLNSIKNRKFLSDFEKIVRDYFKENNFPLDAYETLSSDIYKYEKEVEREHNEISPN